MAGAPRNAAVIARTKLNMKAMRIRTCETPTRISSSGSPSSRASVTSRSTPNATRATDTSSVAMNPVIKFTTLFGVLATQIAVTIPKDQEHIKWIIGGVLFCIALVFIHRSFYGMRIPQESTLKMKKG